MSKERLKTLFQKLIDGFTVRKVALILLGCAITSFGLYNVHQQSHITEGGVLGMVLLLQHWFHLPASISNPILDIACYALATHFLGGAFLKLALFTSVCMAGFFRIWEQFPPFLPDLSPHPLLAAVVGALFIGIGVGIVIRQGSSCGGDDALALTISHVTHCRISHAYMVTDFTVLALSLSYIPAWKIAFSLITVTLSSYLIDMVQRLPIPGQTAEEHDDAAPPAPIGGQHS